MSKYKVSIVVPVYKVEKLLDRCVHSLLNQTYKNLEIILVDDGSPDSSGDICDHYSKIDTRVKVIHKLNGGLSDARNFGIEKASGDYIMFVDSDDYIDEDSVNVLVKFATQNNLDIACADAYRIIEFEGKENKERLIGEKSFSKVITGEEFLVKSIEDKNYSVAVWSRLYKTDLIKDKGTYFKKGIYHEDEEWSPRIMLKAKRISYIDYPFYYYVIRKNSITQLGNRNKHIKDVIETCEDLAHQYESIVEDNKNKKVLKDYLVRLYINTSTFGHYDSSYYKSVINKKFTLRNAYYLSTFIQSVIYNISPYFYRMLKLAYVKKSLGEG